MLHEHRGVGADQKKMEPAHGLHAQQLSYDINLSEEKPEEKNKFQSLSSERKACTKHYFYYYDGNFKNMSKLLFHFDWFTCRLCSYVVK